MLRRHALALLMSGLATGRAGAQAAPAGLSAQPATAALPPSPLPAEVDAALARARLPREAAAFYVADASGAQAPRLAWRADVPVNPASMAKLVTTYAALELLGPAFAWSTPVFVDGTVQGGTLRGQLYIQGRGDPKLVSERLWLLLRRVQGLGIRHIAGDIVLDRSAFDLPPVDPGAFDGEPLRAYNVVPDALMPNYKTLGLTFTPLGAEARIHAEPPLAGVDITSALPLAAGDCGDWRAAIKPDFSDPLRIRFNGAYPAACGERGWSVAYPDARSYAARAVAGMWQSLGGTVAGQVREGRVPAQLRPAFELQSPALPEVIRDINKFSNNVMAQQLFLTLGLQAGGAGTLPASREVLRAWWAARIGGDTPVFDNGSGLSRDERITAQQLGRLLQVAWVSPLMPELASSLPLAGLDGTMRRARRNIGLAHLKTGSLRDVAGVAGYVHGAAGRRWALVAVANHARAGEFRPAIDALVDWAGKEA